MSTEKIASGVKKIRLKINNEFLDVECYRYKKDYFSDFIQEESILLLQKLIDSKSKDIHDDFLKYKVYSQIILNKVLHSQI